MLNQDVLKGHVLVGKLAGKEKRMSLKDLGKGADIVRKKNLELTCLQFIPLNLATR